MGGGDLNLKKSWHPLTFRNQEKIWKEKQNAEAEKKKIEQIQKELHKERQQEEFERLQEAAGIRKASDRLEWMYSAPAASGQVQPEDLESYLLGKKGINSLLKAREKDTLKPSAAVDIFEQGNKNANNVRDTQAKIREDPLLAIKKKEREVIEATLKNPLLMKEIQKKHKRESEKSKSSSKSHKKSIEKEIRSSDRDKKPRSSSSSSKKRDHDSKAQLEERRKSRNNKYEKGGYRDDKDDKEHRSKRHREHASERTDCCSRSSMSPRDKKDHRGDRHYQSTRGSDRYLERFPDEESSRASDRERKSRGYETKHQGQSRSYRHNNDGHSYNRRSGRSTSPRRHAKNKKASDNQAEDTEREEKQKQNAALLERMAQDAKKVNDDRKQYVTAIRDQDKEEEEQLNREQIKHSEQGTTSSYLQEISESAYGQLSSITLEERLRRNRAFISRDLASGE